MFQEYQNLGQNWERDDIIKDASSIQSVFGIDTTKKSFWTGWCLI